MSQSKSTPLIELAEGIEHDDRAALWSAWVRQGDGTSRRPVTNLHVRELLMYVFATDRDGRGVQMTYDELALKLECTRKVARSVVDRAASEFGMLAVKEQRYASGGQTANRYSIEWPVVRAINAGMIRRSVAAKSTRPIARPPAPSGQAPVLTGQAPVPRGQPYKETPELNSRTSSGTGTGAAAVTGQPVEVGKRTTSTASGLAGGGCPIDQRIGDRATETESGPLAAALIGQGDPLMDALPMEVTEAPIVADALMRRVDPLPPRSLMYGPWSKLQERHFDSTACMVEWFRRQLAIPNPVVGGTEAHLLMVIAAALYATRLPVREIRKSRVGLFVTLVSRGQWQRVLGRVPEARDRLDGLLQADGSALTKTDPAPDRIPVGATT